MADLPISTAQASVNESKSTIAPLEVTISNSNITTASSWNGRIIAIDNTGALGNIRQIQINHNISCAGFKNDTGDITFTQGTGRTLRLVDNTPTMLGKGSSFSIISIGTIDYLSIVNKKANY
jgi:hypothetical protein